MHKKLLLIKLVSGEELVGADHTCSNGYNEGNAYTLKEVFQVVVIPQKDGSQQIGMLPFHIHTKLHEELTVESRHVIFATEPGPEISSQYLQFTTRIITPQSQGIIIP